MNHQHSKTMGILLALVAAVIWPELLYAQTLTVTTGKEEPVFAVSEKPCAFYDRPDAPFHAFHDAKGGVQVIASSNINYRQTGPDLQHLKRDCHIIFKGGQDADPAHNNNEGWIHGTYTADGKTIYALVHNEYWGNRFIPSCKNHYTRCWWNSITWVKSTDGGQNYTLPPVDKRLVIGMSVPYKPNVGHPVGFMNPSNILPVDNHLYAFTRVMGYAKQRTGNYLLRKPVNAPWNQWQVWDGQAFSDIHKLMKQGGAVGQPINVGRAEGFPHAAPMIVLSVSRHEPDGKFIALMVRGSRLAFHNAEKGFYIATSTDLIHWSEPQQIMQASTDCIKNHKGPQSFYRYYSLVDPSSTSRNFSTVGNNPYIYTTKITVDSCSAKKSLELVRIPVHFETK